VSEPFITSVDVRCSRGGHEYVSVWIRGQSVGTLCVGKGDGQALRELLLPGATGFEEEPTVAERPCAQALRHTVLGIDPALPGSDPPPVNPELLDRALGMGSPERFRHWDERPGVLAEQRIVEPRPAWAPCDLVEVQEITVTQQQREAMVRIREGIDASFRRSPIGQRMRPTCACPPNLKPDDATLSMGRALGMTEDDVLSATASFVSYWHGKGGQAYDWQAKLRHWLRQVATSPAVQR
jgi:hypothetical protein